MQPLGTAQLLAALAGEHAAVYAYGVGGAHLAGRGRQRALDGLAAHRANRDLVAARLRAAGGEPPGPRPGYALPFPVRDAGSAVRLLSAVERRLADVYGDVVAATQGGQRREAAELLSAAAVSATAWSGRTEPFPGLVDPPD
jgi:Domain of unknown function (DUF4439)